VRGDSWWSANNFGEPLQVLCDGRQRELELCATWTSQTQSIEPENTLEVREQHLDLLAVAAFAESARAQNHSIYLEMESMGMTSVRPPNPAVSRRETMQELWRKAELDSVETRVIRIPVLYSDFNDFWDSNAAPIGPQGKLIDAMSASAREELRARLRRRLPVALDGQIIYESYANAVKGRVF